MLQYERERERSRQQSKWGFIWPELLLARFYRLSIEHNVKEERKEADQLNYHQHRGTHLKRYYFFFVSLNCTQAQVMAKMAFLLPHSRIIITAVSGHELATVTRTVTQYSHRPLTS